MNLGSAGPWRLGLLLVACAVPVMASATSKALVVRDAVYWWSAGCPNPTGGAVEQELEDQSVDYDSISSSALSNTDLDDYNMIFLADCQTDVTYNNWNAMVPDLGAWVVDGGMLAVHATRNCSANNVQADIPGGTPSQNNQTNSNGTVQVANHPVLKNLPNQPSGNSLAHDNYPSTGNITDINLIQGNQSGTSILFERLLGAGSIIYGGLTYECYQHTCGSCGPGHAGDVLANEVVYGRSFCGEDGDGDGEPRFCGDCNDFNPSIHRGATDIPGNGIDEDCLWGDAIGLGQPQPAVAGVVNTWTVTHGNPGSTVHLFGALSPGAAEIANCSNMVLSLNFPRLLDSATVSANGTATLQSVVPAMAAGHTLHLQAAQEGICKMSERVPVDWP